MNFGLSIARRISTRCFLKCSEKSSLLVMVLEIDEKVKVSEEVLILLINSTKIKKITLRLIIRSVHTRFNSLEL